MNSKVFITGGAGYLGSVMVPTFLENGHHVTVLDSFIFRQNSLLNCCANKNFEIVRGDCRDEILLKELTKDKDFIIPLAALVGAPLCDLEKENAQSVNVGAVKNLCQISALGVLLIQITERSANQG